jgi:hypothetical protein
MIMGTGQDTNRKRLAAPALLLAAVLSLTACGTVAGPEAPEAREDRGAVVIRIALGSTALQKRAAPSLAKKGDTVITLDTLHLVLTSPDCPTRLVDLPVSGSIQAGAQVLTAKIEGLKPLRNWKVKAYSRDLADTVLHDDSTTFYVKPADTAQVSMLLTPRYSVLVARFVSTWTKVDAIKKLELLVNGSVVDDTVFAQKVRTFDVRLSHKYLKANAAASVELRAYTNTTAASLRYVRAVTLNTQASQDSEVTVPLLDAP